MQRETLHLDPRIPPSLVPEKLKYARLTEGIMQFDLGDAYNLKRYNFLNNLLQGKQATDLQFKSKDHSQTVY